METKFKEQDVGKVYLDKNKERYIKAEKSGISQIDLLIGNIEFTGFGKEKQTYISIKETIKWYKNEINENTTCSESYMKQLKANLEFLENLLIADLVIS